MKTYNSIPHFDKSLYGLDTIAFNKYDGSNMRFEWNKKRGFFKFGTRREMINEYHPHFGYGVDLFMEKYSEDLERVFMAHKEYKHSRNFVCFAEYVGPQSFSGQHYDDKKDMDIILFDVCQFQKGFLSASKFIEHFGHLHIPDVIYQGTITEELVNDIKNSTELDEGVIFNGDGFRKKGQPYSWKCKLKTISWLNKVKNKLGQEAIDEDIGDSKIYL
jgi:hypothetical protein